MILLRALLVALALPFMLALVVTVFACCAAFSACAPIIFYFLPDRMRQSVVEASEAFRDDA